MRGRKKFDRHIAPSQDGIVGRGISRELCGIAPQAHTHRNAPQVEMASNDKAIAAVIAAARSKRPPAPPVPSSRSLSAVPRPAFSISTNVDMPYSAAARRSTSCDWLTIESGKRHCRQCAIHLRDSADATVGQLSHPHYNRALYQKPPGDQFASGAITLGATH